VDSHRLTNALPGITVHMRRWREVSDFEIHKFCLTPGLLKILVNKNLVFRCFQNILGIYSQLQWFLELKQTAHVWLHQAHCIVFVSRLLRFRSQDMLVQLVSLTKIFYITPASLAWCWPCDELRSSKSEWQTTIDKFKSESEVKLCSPLWCSLTAQYEIQTGAFCSVSPSNLG